LREFNYGLDSFKLFCFLLPGLFVCHFSSANYFFQHYTISNGLPNNTINQIFKDRYGFIWICTANGLSQYDGYNFRNFFNNPQDSSSLPNNSVTSITEDKNGLLWIGMWGGVATFNPKTQNFRNLKLPFEKNYDKIMHIFCDSKNRIWISTTVGNYLFNTDGTLIKHWNAGKGPNDLNHNEVVFTQQDQDGNIWVTGRCGLCRFREETMDYEVIPDNHPPYLEGNHWLNSVNEGSVGKDGMLWYGSWANGLRRIDPKTKNYTTWLTKPESITHGAYNVVSATCEFDGKIWVASQDQGLGYLDHQQNKLVFLRNLNMPGYDMPSGLTNRLLADGEILWVGTNQGLYKYDLRKQLFQVFHFSNIQQGTCLPDIQTVAPYLSNDLLLGTWTCGLFQFSADKTSANKRSNAFFDKPFGDLNVDIKHIKYDRYGTHWFATSHGLYVESQSKSSTIRPGGEVQEMVKENYFYKVLQSKDGIIWAGSEHGILKIDPETWQYKKLNLKELAAAYVGKTSDRVIDISEAPNGDIWFLRWMGGELFQLGFTVLRKNTGKFITYVAGRGKFKNYPFPQTAYSFKATSDGNIFVSSERGLTKFNATNPQKFEHFTTFHGLLADKCYELEEDNNRNLWVLGIDGLSCLELKSSKIKTYTVADGLPPAGLISLTKLFDGNIAIGMNSGWLSLLRPERLKMFNTESSMFKFTSLEVENRFLWPSDSLELLPNTKVVKLSFSPLNFFTSADLNYHISISKGGQITNYQTTSNQIFLSDLRHGWYQIKVSAPGLKTIDIQFYKKPWFWQTTWFLVLCIVIAFTILTTLLLYRQRKILAKREQERSIQFQISDMQMTALRSQIDAHFIFNALNAINNFIWQKLPEQASDYLTQFARLMRINLEHTRNDWVPLMDEMDAVKYYFNLEALAFEPIPTLEINLPSTTELAKITIPPMLMQPIVENVFKHAFVGIAHQGTLKIEVKFDHDLLIVNTLDNGRGFVLSASAGSHKSLASRIMNERLDLLNKKLGTLAGFKLERINIEGQEQTLATLKIPFKFNQI